MDISGKVSRIMPLVSGQGRNGEWRKQEFVIEIEAGSFPKKVCLSLWGDKIDQAQLREGAAVKVFFDLESREYNGRWYTEARAWRVEPDLGAPSAPAEASTDYPAISAPASPEQDSTADDLPF
jgi:hypothetical protein